MPFSITIPARVKTGSVLPIIVDKPTKAFVAKLMKNPKLRQIEMHGRDVWDWEGETIQIEQENTKQEGPAVDGVIHLELIGKDGKALPTGKYLVWAWAGDDNPKDGIEGATSKEQFVILY